MGIKDYMKLSRKDKINKNNSFEQETTHEIFFIKTNILFQHLSFIGGAGPWIQRPNR